MKKEILLNFIKKHTPYLEKCRWVSSSKTNTLKVSMATEIKDLMVDITLSNWDGLSDVELGIISLPKFERELKGILGDDITLSLNYNDDKTQVVNVEVTDGPSTATIVLSDLDILPQSSNLKKKIIYNAEIVFDEEFITRFQKAKAALPEVDYFTVMMNKKNVLEMVLGYSSINSSRYTLQIKTNPGMNTVSESLTFHAGYLKSILDVNSECVSAVLRVSDMGLCNIEFKSGDLDCKYYLTSLSE